MAYLFDSAIGGLYPCSSALSDDSALSLLQAFAKAQRRGAENEQSKNRERGDGGKNRFDADAF